MFDEHIGFFETLLVQQQGDALARREFAFFVLAFNASFAAPEPGFLASRLERFDYVLHFDPSSDMSHW
jgi:hypothetical protein